MLMSEFLWRHSYIFLHGKLLSKPEWSSGARSSRTGNSQKTQLGLEGE